MKSLFTPFLLILLFFTQCKKPAEDVIVDTSYKEKAPCLTQITGTILNRGEYPDTKELRLKIPVLAGSRHDIQLIMPIRDDNTFEFSFELAQPQQLSMVTFIDFLYLRPGDSIHIELDFRNIMSVRLSGNEAADINRDFYKYFNATFYRGNDYGVGTDCEINCSVKEIRRQMDEIKRLNYERRTEFLQKNTVRKEVVSLSEAMIEIDYYQYLIQSMQRRQYLYHKDFINPDSLWDEVNCKVMPYFNTDSYSVSHVDFILDGYLSVALMKDHPDLDNNQKTWVNKVETCIDGIKCNDNVKNMMWAALASTTLVQKDLNSFEQFCNHIDTNYTYLLARLSQEYQMTWNHMNNPELISNAITGKSTDTGNEQIAFTNNLISETIKAHTGKILVIDILATWCRPCIQSLGNYKELKKEYAGKNVDFEFICLYGTEEIFNKILKNNELNDCPHHLATNEEVALLHQTFGMFGIPFGILVNKKGVIVDYGSYVRPEAGLREKIDHLLNHDTLLK